MATPWQLSSSRPPVRETIDPALRQLISQGAVNRGEGSFKSLALEHLDLRLHPPRHCLLLADGAPYTNINMTRLRRLVPCLLVEATPSQSLEPLSDLDFEREFFRCFIEYTAGPPVHDAWSDPELSYTAPLSDIQTTAGVRLEDTRAYQALEKSLPSVSFRASSPAEIFRHPTLAIKTIGPCTVLDAIVSTHRFKPTSPTRIAVNIDDELYAEAINHFSPVVRHCLHLRHCCPWAGAVDAHCRCPNYSLADPRTRLPRLLPELAFGVEGAKQRREALQQRINSPEYLQTRQAQHTNAMWTKAMNKLMGPETRYCIAQSLLRLLAGYQMCGSVYGASVITTRFTRFFVLSSNRIAVEILDEPRANYGGIPRSLPWNTREQSEAKKAYVERPTNLQPPSFQRLPNRRIASEALRPSSAQTTTTRAPRSSLPAVSATRTPSPRRPSSGDDASDMRYGVPPLAQIPPAHVLRTPPRTPPHKAAWKKVVRRARASLPSQVPRTNGDLVASQSQMSATHNNRTPTADDGASIDTSASAHKPLPPNPENIFPACSLPPDYRPSISYKELFTDDLFNRLPWSFITWAGPAVSKEGEGRNSRCIVDGNAVQAFSNLLTAAIIRIGQMPHKQPMVPLPVTNQYPRKDAVKALVECARLPSELSEIIVDRALALDEQPTAHKRPGFGTGPSASTLYSLSGSSGPGSSEIVPSPIKKRPINKAELWPMEQALESVVRFVPVSRGEMEALICRQVRSDRRRYFTTFPKKMWPEHWLKNQ